MKKQRLLQTQNTMVTVENKKMSQFVSFVYDSGYEKKINKNSVINYTHRDLTTRLENRPYSVFIVLCFL